MFRWNLWYGRDLAGSDRYGIGSFGIRGGIHSVEYFNADSGDAVGKAAIFRFLNPEADIRMAGGRVLMKDAGRKVFLSGANAAITGDMLTTTGSRTKEDQQMLRDLGYKTGGQE